MMGLSFRGDSEKNILVSHVSLDFFMPHDGLRYILKASSSWESKILEDIYF